MTLQSAEHFESARRFLRDAEILLDAGSFSSSISRSYYAAFHCAKAALSDLEIPRKSHQAVWAAFGQQVTKPGLMDKKFHSGGVRLFSSRMKSDYFPNSNDSGEAAQKALSFAAEFVAACRAFLESRKMGGAE